MTRPRQCGACRARVIQAFTDTGRALLLDIEPPAPHGAIAARLDTGTGVWRARFLRRGEDHNPDTEVRFRQHTVSCAGTATDSLPVILPADVTDTTVTSPPTEVLEPLPADPKQRLL